MRRGWKILAAALVALAILLAVNAYVVGEQTKPAETTVENGRIVELPGGDVQVVETGPERRRGAGAPIVLIHCFACSLEWWDAMVPLLAERHRVIRVDLLGHGGSEKPASGYEIPQQAQLVAGTLNDLGVQGAVVVGHSLGGIVAVALAEGFSQLTDRVATIGTAPAPGFAELAFAARLAHSPVLGEAMWRLAFDFAVRDQYEAAFAPGFDVEGAFDDPDQVLEDNDAMTFSSFDQIEGAVDDYAGDASLEERMRTTPVPLMAIFGADDQIIDDPEGAAEAFGGVPGARTVVMPDVGHSPNVEDPERTARLILRFAAGADVAGQRAAP